MSFFIIKSLLLVILLLSTFITYVAIPVSSNIDQKVSGALISLGILVFVGITMWNIYKQRKSDTTTTTITVTTDRAVASVAPTPTQLQQFIDKRTHYLDNIKVVLIFFVVLGHSTESAGGIVDVFSPTIANYSHSLYYVCLVISIPIFPVAMNLFFFISGLFVPGSYQRKGRLVFIKDKLQRYLIPTLLSWLIIMPLSVFLTATATGKRYRYSDFEGGLGPAWFLLWLSFFLLAYAFLQQDHRTATSTTPTNVGDDIEKQQIVEQSQSIQYTSSKMTEPESSPLNEEVAASTVGKLSEAAKSNVEKRVSAWWNSHFTLDPTLYLWILGIGCIGALVVFASRGYKGIQLLERSPLPGDSFPYWIPYFFGGCYASSKKWMNAFNNNNNNNNKSVPNKRNSHKVTESSVPEPEQSTSSRSRDLVRCAYWTAPIFVLCLLALTIYLVKGQDETDSFGESGFTLSDLLVVECFSALVGLGMILVILDFTSRHLNMINKLLLFMTPAAYTVYLIQPPVIAAITWLWIWILRTSLDVNIVFEEGASFSQSRMNEGIIWLGWVFICTVVQLIIWPLAFCIRLLPGLNRIL